MLISLLPALQCSLLLTIDGRITPSLQKFIAMSFLQLCILVLGALGGRFDHEMGNINVLHIFPNINIILLSNDCLIFLLPKTHTHEIHVERSIEGPHCGLIPIGMPSTSTTTTGLQWNLGECRPYLAWCRFSNKK